MKIINIFSIVLALCSLIQACSCPSAPVSGPLSLPGFDLRNSNRQQKDSEVRISMSLTRPAISGRYHVLFTTSDIENMSLTLYDQTGTKFPSGGLIKTNDASQTALTSSTAPDYFSDISMTATGVATASYDNFMIRQATGSAGFTGSTYTATFKHIKDGAYTLVAEAARKDNPSSPYVSIGHASSSVTVSPFYRDFGSYTTISVATLSMTLI